MDYKLPSGWRGLRSVTKNRSPAVAEVVHESCMNCYVRQRVLNELDAPSDRIRMYKIAGAVGLLRKYASLDFAEDRWSSEVMLQRCVAIHHDASWCIMIPHAPSSFVVGLKSEDEVSDRAYRSSHLKIYQTWSCKAQPY